MKQQNSAESASLIQEIEDHGVQVVSAMEGNDPLARNFFLGLADYYSKELAISTRDGLAARFRQGTTTGGICPFGYKVVPADPTRTKDVDPKKLAVNEAEAAVIRELVEIYLSQNIGLKLLCRRLIER